MSLVPQISAALSGILSGIVTSAARWLSDVFRGYAKWATTHFIMILIIGGFTGFMGNAMADATAHPEWVSVFSGVFGAMGAFGFESLLQLRKKLSSRWHEGL